jgi:DNA-binding response OmpR family regulator
MTHHLITRIPEHGDRRHGHYSGRVLLASARTHERLALADYLSSRGFCALETNNAGEAYRLASEVPVAIVITDVELAGEEDGFSLTRRLKADPRIHQIPVLILADRIVDSVRQAAHTAGCDLLSRKTCRPRLLLQLIDPLVTCRRNT